MVTKSEKMTMPLSDWLKKMQLGGGVEFLVDMSIKASKDFSTCS